MSKRYLVIFEIVVAILWLLFAYLMAEANTISCTTQVVVIEKPNKISFDYSCVGIDEGWQAVDFGDNSFTDVYFTQNLTATTWHDYSYIPGGVITYTSVLTVNEGEVEYTFPTEVVIDDRPFVLFMPFITFSGPSPSCQISVLSQDTSYFVFSVSWQNAGSGEHTFYFGDGDLSFQFYGKSGTGETWHNYPWPGGSFTTSMDLDGGGSCRVDINYGFPR